MELCEKCDIVHNDLQCPLCKAYEEIERLGDVISDRDDEIADLEDKIYDLEKELENK